MGYAELIERLQALPQDKQAEVLDFVEFLSSRAVAAGEAENPRGEWSNAEFAGLAMAQALRDNDDDPIVYTAADLRERWQ